MRARSRELAETTPAALVLAALCFLGVTLVVEGANGPSWTLLNHFTLGVVTQLPLPLGRGPG